MDLIRINPFLVYDHEQGLFMIYKDSESVRLIPKHFITEFSFNENSISLICNSKHHKEQISLESKYPKDDAEQIDYILNELR